MGFFLVKSSNDPIDLLPVPNRSTVFSFRVSAIQFPDGVFVFLCVIARGQVSADGYFPEVFRFPAVFF